jgi:hypothetical protein
MRQVFWICSLFLLLCPRSAVVVKASAADQISVQEIAGLLQSERVAVMKTYLERRIEKVRNVDVTSETRVSFRKYLNGKLGELVAEGSWYQFRTLHCDGAYRVTSSWFVNQATTVPDSTSVSHYDAKTGISRIVSHAAQRKGQDGRIGFEPLPSLGSNRVAFYLLGGSFVIPSGGCDRCEFLLESLSSCSDKWHVDVDIPGKQVIIRHPYRIAFVNNGTGERKVRFDVTKGMLPVTVDMDWRGYAVTSQDGKNLKPIWREERVLMDDPSVPGQK